MGKSNSSGNAGSPCTWRSHNGRFTRQFTSDRLLVRTVDLTPATQKSGDPVDRKAKTSQ
jgi:hypothetical protein